MPYRNWGCFGRAKLRPTKSPFSRWWGPPVGEMASPTLPNRKWAVVPAVRVPSPAFTWTLAREEAWHCVSLGTCFPFPFFLLLSHQSQKGWVGSASLSFLTSFYIIYSTFQWPYSTWPIPGAMAADEVGAVRVGAEISLWKRRSQDWKVYVKMDKKYYFCRETKRLRYEDTHLHVDY